MASALWAMGDVMLVMGVGSVLVLLSSIFVGPHVRGWFLEFESSLILLSSFTTLVGLAAAVLVARILERSRGGCALADFGVTLAGRGLGHRVMQGLSMYLIAVLPLSAWTVVQGMRQDLDVENVTWRVWEAVSGSYGLWNQAVPMAILDSIVGLAVIAVFLAYGVTRYRDGFGKVGATILFAIPIIMGLIDLGMSFSGFGLYMICAVFLVVVVAHNLLRTGSLVPGLVALLLSQVPIQSLLAGIMLVGTAVLLMDRRFEIVGEFRAFRRDLARTRWRLLMPGLAILALQRLSFEIQWADDFYLASSIGTMLLLGWCVVFLLMSLKARKFVPRP